MIKSNLFDVFFIKPECWAFKQNQFFAISRISLFFAEKKKVSDEYTVCCYRIFWFAVANTALVICNETETNKLGKYF